MLLFLQSDKDSKDGEKIAMTSPVRMEMVRREVGRECLHAKPSIMYWLRHALVRGV